jgi:hypothetical protein
MACSYQHGNEISCSTCVKFAVHFLTEEMPATQEGLWSDHGVITLVSNIETTGMI